jgi:hypothetical protein
MKRRRESAHPNCPPPNRLERIDRDAVEKSTRSTNSAKQILRQLTLDFPPRTGGLVGLGGPFDSLTCDADLHRLMKNSVAETDVISKSAEVAKYVEGAIMSRTPLVLTDDELFARSVQKAGCPAVPWPKPKPTEDFIESIAAVAPYFDGIYVLMSDQSVFTLRPYQLCYSINLAHRFNRRAFSRLGYLGLPVTTPTLALALENAVPGGSRFHEVENDAIDLIKAFLPRLALLPDFESSLARIAARSRPKISKRIAAEILPHSEVDAPLFRKNLRAEKARIEYARLDREVQSALCA